MREIEIGEYIRTTDGYIGKLIEINKKNWNYLTVDCKNQLRTNDIYPRNYLYLKEENITKHSKELIDLIEVGDFVNGLIVDGKNQEKVLVRYISEDIENPYGRKMTIQKEFIEEILTKEQYNANKFVVEED